MSKRGRIETITLHRAIVFNEKVIVKAKIEIDHINYGLDENSQGLKHRKRSNFTINDIEKFLMLLDGESITASKYRGKTAFFKTRISCPVKGLFFGQEFIMVFSIDYDSDSEIHTITLFPGW